MAVDYALSWGLEAIEVRVTALADLLRQALQHLSGVHVHDQGRRRSGIVTFTVDGVPAQDVQQQRADRGVNVSVPLVDHARLDLPHRELPDLLRASVQYYNIEDDLAAFSTRCRDGPCDRPSRRTVACGTELPPDSGDRSEVSDYPQPGGGSLNQSTLSRRRSPPPRDQQLPEDPFWRPREE